MGFFYHFKSIAAQLSSSLEIEMAITYRCIMRYMYIYMHLCCTSKAGVRLFVCPRREEQTDVCAHKPHPSQ